MPFDSLILCGWFSAEIARASRSNRALNGSVEILIATLRSSRSVERSLDFVHSARAEEGLDLVRS